MEQNLFISKGNLGDSPKGRYIARKDGTGDFYVATMRMMFGRYKRNADGEFEQIGGIWREVELYGQKAQDAVRLLKRGARVLVIGQEQEYTGTDENGNEVQVIKIVADDVALILSRVDAIKFARKSSDREESEEFAEAS